MVIDQRHIELEGRTVISHFTFKPPLIATSDLENQGCFIFPLNTSGQIYRENGRTFVSENQGLLMKCGTYVNKWEGVNEREPSEVVILRLFPDILESVLDTRTITLIKKRMAVSKTTALVRLDTLMQKYLESLFFYFDNPSLVTDELVNLKIKELMLLLVSIREPNDALDLLSGLFEKEKFGLRQIVDANAFESLSLDEIASLANMSTPSFKRKFKQYLGESPGQYIRQRRMNVAAEKLRTTVKAVSEIAYDVGYNDPNYFSRVFQTSFGCSPMRYRNNQNDV